MEEKEALEMINKSIDEKVGSVASEMGGKVEDVQKNLDKVNDVAVKSAEEVASLKAELKAIRSQKAAEIANRMSRQAVYSAVIKSMLESNKEDIAEAVRTHKSWGSKIQSKAAFQDITDSVITDNTTANPILGTVKPGLVPALREHVHLRDLCAVEHTTSPFIFWTESSEGTAKTVNEGTAKTDAAFTWATNQTQTQVIANYVKVSEQALSDIDNCAGKLSEQMAAAVLHVEDTQILTGDGTASNLKGIATYATAFDTTSSNPLYQSIVDATEIDVLRAAMMQIRNAKGTCDTIFLNPSDAAKIDLLKATNDQYIAKPISEILRNVNIIETTDMTAGDFIVADMTRSHYAIQWDFKFDIGLEGDDFKKNMVTMRCEVRGAHYIAANEDDCFVKGTFSTCITALAVPAEE